MSVKSRLTGLVAAIVLALSASLSSPASAQEAAPAALPALDLVLARLAADPIATREICRCSREPQRAHRLFDSMGHCYPSPCC